MGLGIQRGIHWWVSGESPLKGLGFLRIVVGFMLIRHTFVFMQSYVRGDLYSDYFHVHYYDWLHISSEWAYTGLLASLLFLGVFIILGIQLRITLPLSFLLCTYHLFLNQFWYRHNRYFLLLLLFLLCLSPAAKIFSPHQRNNIPKMPAKGFHWSMLLMRIQMSLIYLSSAFSKTLDPDWSSGEVLWKRGLLMLEPMQGSGGFWMPILESYPFWFGMTLIALGTEYFLGFMLWVPRLHRLAFWIGIIFHGYIEIAYSVLVFSYLTLGTYFLAVSPNLQNRSFFYNPHNSRQQKIAQWLAWNDWFDKMVFIPHEQQNIVFKDEKGRTTSGWMAYMQAYAMTPLFFTFSYPFTWLRWLGVGRTSENLSSQSVATPFYQNTFNKKPFIALAACCISYLGFLWIITEYFYIRHQRLTVVDIVVLIVICILTMQTYRKQIVATA